MLHLYRSSAGSGKTYTLALYYVALLMQRPERYRNILAVTFTNKATREMKDRILAFLDTLAHGDDPALRANLRATGPELARLEDTALAQKAAEALHAILHDYGRFSVTTLDSFFQYMLRGFARELRLPLGMEIELDLQRVVRFAVEGLLEEAGHDKTLTAWLTDMLEARIEDERGWRVSRGIELLGWQLFQESFQHIAPTIPAAEERQLEQLKAYIQQELKAYKQRENVTEFKKHRAQVEAVVAEWDQNGLSVEDFVYKSNGPYAYIRRLAQAETLLETEPATKRLLHCFEAPSKLPQKDSPHKTFIQERAEAAWMPVLQAVTEALDEKRPHLQAVDNVLRNLYAYGLLSYLQQQVKQYRDQYEMNLISDAPDLIERLRQNAGTEFIYEKAGTRYEHFLLDEFQDTNRRQWNNLKPLLQEALASGGSGLVVGDAKQSIYRWRGGDMHLLQSGVEAELKRATDIHREELRTNRRSTARIVRFNNALFENLPGVLNQYASQTGDALLGDAAEAYRQVSQDLKPQADPGGALRLSIRPASSRKPSSDHEAEEALASGNPVLRELAESVAALREQGQPLSDIGVLVRKKNEAFQVAQTLIEHGIPVVSEESLLLKSSPKVALIVAMMGRLDGRSPALRLAEAHYFYQKHLVEANPGQTAPEAIAQPPSAETFAPLFHTHEIEGSLSALMPHELVEALIRRFSLDAQGPDTFLVQFQNLVREAEARGATSLSTFLDEWENSGQQTSIAMPEALEAVRVLTIHKAKGLQFDTVLMPFADWALVDLQAQRNLLWAGGLNQRPFRAEAVAWHPFQPKKDCIGTVLEAPYQQERNEQLAESLNLLYVAFTRAERQLQVWARHKKDDGLKKSGPTTVGDLLRLSLPELTLADESLTAEDELETETTCFSLGTFTAKASAGGPEASEVWRPGAYRSVDWGEVVRVRRHGSGIPPTEEALEDPRRRGLLYHSVLARMETFEDLPGALDQLHREGHLGSEALRTRLEERLRAFLAGPTLRRWFSPQWRVYTEIDLLAPASGARGEAPALRPDRLLVGEERVVILDYKTGGTRNEALPLPKDVKQMQRYLERTRPIFPQHQVEGHLLYLDAENHFPVQKAQNP